MIYSQPTNRQVIYSSQPTNRQVIYSSQPTSRQVIYSQPTNRQVIYSQQTGSLNDSGRVKIDLLACWALIFVLVV